MGEVRQVALEPEVHHDGRQRGHRPPHERRQRRQPARVAGDHDHVRVDVARVGGDRGDPSAADHQVAHLDARAHLHLAGGQPVRQRVGERGHPARDGPRAEALLDVRRHAGPGGHVARVVSLGDRRVQRQLGQPLVLEPADPLGQRLAAPQPVGQRRGQVGGVPGALEVLAAQHLPVVGVRLHVLGPARPQPGAEGVDGLDLRGPRAEGQPHRRPVREPVLAQHVQLDELELALQRAVRTCGTGRARPPAGACTTARRPRRTRPAPPAPARRPAAARAPAAVTWWPSLASRAATAIPPNPPPTTTTRMAAIVGQRRSGAALRSPRSRSNSRLSRS